MDNNNPTTIDAVKLVLGYASVLAALAYGMGIAEESSFLAHLGLTRDLNVADPVHFGYGGLLLAGTLWPLAFVVPLRAQRATFSRRAVVSILIACCAVEFVFAFYFTIIAHVWIRHALKVAVYATVACAWCGIFLLTDYVRGRNLWRQFVGLIIILIALYNVAASVSDVRAWLTKHGKDDRIRLLVTSDVVPAAQQMGLSFPHPQPGERSAQLSDEVNLVYENERTYVIQVNGRFVHLSKDKVLGTVP